MIYIHTRVSQFYSQMNNYSITTQFFLIANLSFYLIRVSSSTRKSLSLTTFSLFISLLFLCAPYQSLSIIRLKIFFTLFESGLFIDIPEATHYSEGFVCCNTKTHCLQLSRPEASLVARRTLIAVSITLVPWRCSDASHRCSTQLLPCPRKLSTEHSLQCQRLPLQC